MASGARSRPKAGGDGRRDSLSPGTVGRGVAPDRGLALALTLALSLGAARVASAEAPANTSPPPPPAKAASTEQTVEAGWVQPERAALRKIYGLRFTVKVSDPPPLEVHPLQWSAPFVSSDNAIAIAASDGGLLQAFWMESGRLLWKRKDLGTLGRGMAQFEDVLLVGSDSALLGLEVHSGRELWRVDLAGEVAEEPVIVGKIALVAVRPSSIAAVDPSTGKVLWRFKRPGNEGISVRGSPAPTVDVAGRRVFAGLTDGDLVALSLDNGQTLWSATVGKKSEAFPDVDARPVLLDGGREILTASYNGGIARVSAANGQVLWRDESVVHVTAMEDPPDSRWVVASQGDGQVLGIDRRSGQVHWRYKLKKGSPSAPRALGQGLVIVGASTGPASILDVSTGRPVQLVAPGSGVLARPHARGADLLLLSNKGLLLVLRRGEGTGFTH